MPDGPNKRHKPRANFSSSTLAHVGGQTHICRMANISETGILLKAPARQPQGSLVRLELNLPGVDHMLELQGLVVREAEVDGGHIWGLEFQNITPEAVTIIRTFVEWLRKRKEAAGRRAAPAEDPAAKKPPARQAGVALSAQRQQELQRIRERELEALRRKQQEDEELVRRQAEEMAQRRKEEHLRQHEEQELKNLFRTALKDLLGKKKDP